jgi:hypothetical protein
MERPKPIVLPDEALMPRQDLITPPPNRFTHVVGTDQPYYFADPQPDRPPDGTFAAGSKVVLMRDEDRGYCRIVDASGVYAWVECGALRKLGS